MGCCSRFHITWWPDNTSGVIDPNKAFDRHRRLNIIKKLLTSLAIIALIAGSIYLLVWLTSNGSDPNCQQNATKNVEPQVNATNASSPLITQPEKQALIQTTLIPIVPLDSHPQNVSTEETTTEEGTTEEATTVPEALPDSSTAPLTEGTHEVDAGTNKNDSSVILINTDEPRQWCSSKKNAIECVGVTKDFKTVRTFLSNSTKVPNNTTLEGYVLVKMDIDNMWHPYCYKEWTLEMGYKLCHGLGFKSLIKQTTIPLYLLKERIKPLGKDISLQTFAVVPSKSHTDDLQSSDLQCNVGSVTCG